MQKELGGAGTTSGCVARQKLQPAAAMDGGSSRACFCLAKARPGGGAPYPPGAELDRLVGLKLSELKLRAAAAGAGAEALEEALDAPEPRRAVAALVLELEGAKERGLRAELEGLKLSQLRRRALDAGVAAGALDAAEDDEEVSPKDSVIALLLASGASDETQQPQKPQKPHHQLKRIGKSASADLVRAVIPNGKHAMLSYQWCVP